MTTKIDFNSIRSKASLNLSQKYNKKFKDEGHCHAALMDSYRKDCESTKAKELAKTFEGKWFQSKSQIVYVYKAGFGAYGTNSIALVVEGWNFVVNGCYNGKGSINYNDKIYFVEPRDLGNEIPADKIAALLTKKGFNLDLLKPLANMLGESK